MNELELLDRLRAEVPRQQDLRAEEARLRAVIAGGQPREERHRAGARLRWGLALAGVAVVASAVVASGLVPAAGPAPVVTGRAPLTAAEVLEDAALVAERTPATEIRLDQWFYLKERQPIDSLPEYETWTRMDGRRSAIREGDGAELRIGKAEKGRTYPLRTRREISAFPDDPDALLAHLRGMDERAALSICAPECPAEAEDDVRAFGTLQWYLKFGPLISPEKAAAMYRAMARIPRVTIEENVATGDGRTGLGVVLDLGEAGKGYTILDSDDYRYLGAKTVRDGTEFAMSVLASGVVDEAGETP